MLMAAPTPRLWVASAAVVTAARFLHVATPGHDLSFQVEAAQNLLAGNGLTYFDHVSSNLAEPGRLTTLTHFPAGYSLIAAALMGVGLDVGMTLKVLGAAGTVIGWWGWGRLAAEYFRTGPTFTPISRFAAAAIAIGTPVFFTLGWDGTDLFLWAITPWVVLLVTNRGAQRHPTLATDWFIGLLCGLAFLFRYASAFLAMFAAGVVLWQSWRSPRVVAQRAASFSLGFVPAVALQMFVGRHASSDSSFGGVSLASAGVDAWERALHGLASLDVANNMWAFWWPGVAKTILSPDTGNVWSWLILFSTALGLVLAFNQYARISPRPSRDTRSVAIMLFVALPATLLVATIFGSHDLTGGYVADERYYWPLVPLGVLIAYSVTTFAQRSAARIRVVLGTCGGIYVSAYILMLALYIVLMFLPVSMGRTQRFKLLGEFVAAWPSFAVGQELWPSRQYVLELLQERPGAVVMTSRTMAFRWDPNFDRAKLQDPSCDPARPTYVSGPVDLILVTFDLGEPLDLWRYGGVGGSPAVPLDCLEALPGLELMARFPDEGLKVLRARIESGNYVALTSEVRGVHRSRNAREARESRRR
jgi:hypothetical protein